MAKSKRYFAQQVLQELSRDRLNIDFKIDEREVYARLDQVVNEMARKSYFENWKLTGSPGIDEQFITTWDGDNAIQVTDDPDGRLSYITLPSTSWVDLPKNGGIKEIYPTDLALPSVVILSHEQYRLYKFNKVRGMQGRLAGYVKGNIFEFVQDDVGSICETFGVRLVIRDSSALELTDHYPIPAGQENAVISALVEWFRERIALPHDKVRDNNFTPTP